MTARDAAGRVERHFVILCFATRWLAGEPKLNEELSDARWIRPAELTDFKTTDGLAAIVAAAFEQMASGFLIRASTRDEKIRGLALPAGAAHKSGSMLRRALQP